jgi:hypothetical protein
MGKVIQFAEQVLTKEGISETMRTFAMQKLDWKVKMKRMWAFLRDLL